jgi:Arc/MetJ-type ribon-helix-helix transcriptional regulator
MTPSLAIMEDVVRKALADLTEVETNLREYARKLRAQAWDEKRDIYQVEFAAYQMSAMVQIAEVRQALEAALSDA